MGKMHNSFSHFAAKIQRPLDCQHFDSNVNYFDCLNRVLRAGNRFVSLDFIFCICSETKFKQHCRGIDIWLWPEIREEILTMFS